MFSTRRPGHVRTRPLASRLACMMPRRRGPLVNMSMPMVSMSLVIVSVMSAVSRCTVAGAVTRAVALHMVEPERQRSTAGNRQQER